MKRTPVIVLVEDEDELRRSIAFTLRRNGWQVETHARAESAMDSFRRCGPGIHRPDLLITDIRMPGLGGVGLVEQTRTIVPPFPVLVITGQAAKEERRRLADLGVTRILNKPFCLKELVQEVERALSRNERRSS